MARGVRSHFKLYGLIGDLGVVRILKMADLMT